VRSDLLQDKPEMMQAFVEAMMEGSQQIGTQTYNDMAAFYGLKTAAEARDMLTDVHIANFSENKMFFDINNSIGAYKIFQLAQEYYKQLGALPPDASYDPERVLVPQIIAAIDDSRPIRAMTFRPTRGRTSSEQRGAVLRGAEVGL
jgi:hypothetical protein